MQILAQSISGIVSFFSSPSQFLEINMADTRDATGNIQDVPSSSLKPDMNLVYDAALNSGPTSGPNDSLNQSGSATPSSLNLPAAELSAVHCHVMSVMQLQSLGASEPCCGQSRKVRNKTCSSTMNHSDPWWKRPDTFIIQCSFKSVTAMYNAQPMLKPTCISSRGVPELVNLAASTGTTYPEVLRKYLLLLF